MVFNENASRNWKRDDGGDLGMFEDVISEGLGSYSSQDKNDEASDTFEPVQPHSEPEQEQEDAEDVEDAEPQVRSDRIVKRPDYSNDYVKWTLACIDEIESINKAKTWTLFDQLVGAKVIGLKWVFEIKRNVAETFSKFKSQFVVKGYLQEHVQGRVHGVEHIPGSEQGKDILTKALARIKFKMIRSLIEVQDLSKAELKLKRENVG